MFTKKNLKIGLCIGLMALRSSAIEYVFPEKAKVIDITKPPYSADNTGMTDVSAILSKAAKDIIGVPGWCPGILYLPNGTYLVKNTFEWKVEGSNNLVGPKVVGQSRSGTIIKLAKGTWPLGTEMKAVIRTGAGVEQNFNKAIQNLTVLVDSNNAGAIGIIYVSNNTGLLSDVDVISADGKGAYGIQTAWYDGSAVGGQGPLIIRRTYIKGFDVGFRGGNATQGAMISQIRVEGQKKYGVWCSGGQLTIDSLTSNNICPAVMADGNVMLTHGLFTGGAPAEYAVHNKANTSFFSDIVSSGYKAAIQSSGTNPVPTTASFAEYTPVPAISLFGKPQRSMNIPAKYPPQVEWENDFSKWAFLDDYKTGGRTDVQAFQAAIDDPTKTTVCLAGKRNFDMSQPVYVRGTIKRIVGTGTVFNVVSDSLSQLIIEDGTAPMVEIENIGSPNFANKNQLQIVKRSSRTLILESVADGFKVNVIGAGDTYLTDASGGNYVIDNPKAYVGIWQIEGRNVDSDELIVRSGIVRLINFYFEGGGSPIRSQGGFTEVLGFWNYATTCGHANEYWFTVENTANVSVAGAWQQNFCNPWAGFDQFVKETRGADTKILSSSAGTNKIVSPAGGQIGLYTAYDSAAVKNALTLGIKSGYPFLHQTSFNLISAKRTRDGILVSYRSTQVDPQNIDFVTYDLTGKQLAKLHVFTTSGLHSVLIPTPHGATKSVLTKLMLNETTLQTIKID